MRDSKRVIICTEDMFSSSSYTKILQGQGYEVFSAFNGKDLLSLFERLHYEFDLIISDVRIPGLENFDIGDYVALQSGEFIPMIGIAVFPRDEELMMNASEGYTTVLEKGFSAEEFISATSSLLGLDLYKEDEISDEQVKAKAQQLQDTATVVIDNSEFSEFLKVYGQNRSRNSMMDDIAKDEE
jgi:DNA-binding NtrC family response regulator